MSGFDTVGMPEFGQNTAVAGGLRNTNTGNPQGNVVDNSEGKREVADKSQGLSTNLGAYLERQAKPKSLMS